MMEGELAGAIHRSSPDDDTARLAVAMHHLHFQPVKVLPAPHVFQQPVIVFNALEHGGPQALPNGSSHIQPELLHKDFVHPPDLTVPAQASQAEGKVVDHGAPLLVDHGEAIFFFEEAPAHLDAGENLVAAYRLGDVVIHAPLKSRQHAGLAVVRAEQNDVGVIARLGAADLLANRQPVDLRQSPTEDDQARGITSLQALQGFLSPARGEELRVGLRQSVQDGVAAIDVFVRD